VRALVQHAYEQALALVRSQRPALDAWATLLLEKETLEGEPLAKLREAVASAAAARAA
jgi:ATP-dependent Zn protease